MTDSHKTRWEQWPAALVIAGAVACAVATWQSRTTLGHAQWALWLGIAATIAGAILFRRSLTRKESEIEADHEAVRQQQAAFGQRQSEWDAARAAIESQLSQQSRQLSTRESALSNKLIAFHEWMEFPQPLDLSAKSPEPTEAVLGDLARKDRLLEELLTAETQRVLDDILRNKYMVEGKFQAIIARDDILALMTRVARIYQPQIEEPILETSMSHVLRAVSRASLQFLVLAEQLPLNLKQQSFNSLYGYIRQGVKAYGMYKQVQPYFPIVNSAYMLGRFALGANPLTLAAWWFVGAWGQEGAKQLATQLLHRQALSMVQNVVRVIAYETANLYGGDFRHRDPNWLFGVELAELVHRFPLSRESLAAALKQLGALQLRHEYDRVYLYRCLAAHASPDPNRFHVGPLLNAEEKMAIARRLERFLETYIHGQTPQRVTQWRDGVEARLGVKLQTATQADPQNLAQQTTEALRSLASFLLAVKELEPETIAEYLPHCRLFSDLSEEQRAEQLTLLQENPPFYFEHPTLDHHSPLVQKYLQDLAVLAAKTAPHEAVIDDMLVDVAVYLRHDARRMRQLLDKQYVSWLADQLPADAPERRFAPAVARAVLDVIGPRDALRFVYGNVSFDWPEGTNVTHYDRHKTWLVGVADRLIVFTLAERPLLLWRADGNVTAETVRGFLAGDLHLRGGQWLGDVRAEAPTLRISGPLLARHETFFKPLQAMCLQPVTP